MALPTALLSAALARVDVPTRELNVRICAAPRRAESESEPETLSFADRTNAELNVRAAAIERLGHSELYSFELGQLKLQAGAHMPVHAASAAAELEHTDVCGAEDVVTAAAAAPDPFRATRLFSLGP